MIRLFGALSIPTLEDFSSGNANTGLLGADRDGIKNGALGGKILGAGGGGFILLFANPSNHDAIKSSLSDLIHVPFKFDNSGSKIVLYQPEGLE